jgi:hypothetical protein
MELFFEGDPAMRSRVFKHLRTAFLTLACVAMATPVWAQQKNCRCCCQGIDRCGCLTNCGEQSCTLCCVINTKRCTFTGTCRSRVKNCCQKSQCYNNVWFCQDSSLCCTSSCYSCDPCGRCSYTVCGSCQSSHEAS